MSTVLIVDDSSADRAFFRRILSVAGHTVHELSRGADVLNRVREIQPHVLVLDVNLPDADGHELCRALKADPHTSNIPVLMLTVRDREEDVIAGLNAGADDYVAKDEAVEIILARVNRLSDFRKLASVAILNEQLAQVGRLLAGIVHEIRSPLAVIRGHAELIELTLGENPPIRDAVEAILRSSHLLQARLEHLMAAVRTGPISHKLIAIGPLLREATDLFAKGIDPRQKRVKFVVSIPDDLPQVVADPGRIIQVILNLMANAHEAILSARAVGRIEVSVDVVDEGGSSWIRVEVRDDGPGIPPQLLGRIFEPFFTTKNEGSGYGLYLAQELVRNQGGRLEARNRPGGGACFSIRLPVAGEAASIAGDA